MGDRQRRQVPAAPVTAAAPPAPADAGVTASNAALAEDIPRVEVAPVLTPKGVPTPWWADPAAGPRGAAPGPISPAVPGAEAANEWLADPTKKNQPQPGRAPQPSGKFDPATACGGIPGCTTDLAPKSLSTPKFKF